MSSNPPSRGSGQGGKTYGKHEVPVLNVEEEKENAAEGQGEEEGNRTEGEDPPKLVNKQLARPTAGLIHSRSFPASLSSSPVSTPGSQRRQLPPSGIKLPVPPPSLLSGLPNVQKSASSASLNLHAGGVSPSAGKSDQLRETVSVPNATQMLAAARAELVLRGGGGGPIRPAALARLPPLQLPKGPLAEEEKRQMEERQKREEAKEREGGGGEEGGRIATMATESMPQLKPLEPLKMPPQPFLPRPPSADQPPMPNSMPNSTAPSPLPPPPPPEATIASPSPLPARVPPLQPVPNEVPIHHHQHNPMRRSSSAGQLNGGLKDGPMASHKPLPAISEPTGFNKSSRGATSANKNVKQRRARPWRMALKCLVVSLFLSIPVAIFIAMMIFSDGFSSSSSNSSTSTPLPASDAGSPTPAPLTTTPGPTPINIVGGAIFAPISMQNETVG